LGFARYKLGLVRNRVRPIGADRLEQTEEYYRAVAEAAIECDLLAGIVGPLQIRIFDEKGFLVVPTGDLNAVKVGGWVLRRENHSFLHPPWVQAQGQAGGF
jgi:hypothetical protein